MAKTKVSEWSTTPSSNTDIDGINISEGCAPSGINDAIRDMMAQIRSWQSGTYGDTFNGPVNGTVGATTPSTGAFTTLSASSTVTLSGGTANGVAYLNGSKVLTTGSALTFDGTNFNVGIGGVGKIQVGTASSATYQTGFYGSNGVDTDFQIRFKTGITEFGTGTSTPLAFSYGGSEQMRLTSTGLGIGTSSPIGKLHVASGAGLNAYFDSTASGIYLQIANNGTNLGYIGDGGSLVSGGSNTDFAIRSQAALKFSVNGNATAATLDSSGNLGLGVTPSAWSSYKALQVNTTGVFSNVSGTTRVGDNFYYDGSNYRYLTSSYASMVQYNGGGGGFAWFNAPSGTAGNAISFTQAMTLTAAGNLLIGTTSGNGLKLDFSPTSEQINGITHTLTSPESFTDIYGCGTGGTWQGVIRFFTSNNAAASERARIDSSGRLLVGTTSTYSNASKATFQGQQTGGGDGVVAIYNDQATSADSSPPLVLYKAMTTTTSSARFMQFYAGGSATPMGGIVGNGASNVQFATLSDAREKTNIQSISGSLAKINALRPVEFDWIADGSHVKAGFVAQEVETVFPEFVVENMANEGQEARKGLTGGMTGGIIAHLVKAIQEQQAIIDSLKARLDAANL